MPIYEYECARHGGFEAVQSMSHYQEPQPCPDCGAVSPRVILSSVALSCMPSSTRTAHARNERSAHEPQSSKSQQHGKGCSCCSGATAKKNTVTAANGNKAFPTKRPWMISH